MVCCALAFARFVKLTFVLIFLLPVQFAHDSARATLKGEALSRFYRERVEELDRKAKVLTYWSADTALVHLFDFFVNF